VRARARDVFLATAAVAVLVARSRRGRPAGAWWPQVPFPGI